MDLILPALGRSGKLALLAFVITIPISIAAGVYAARRQDKLADRVDRQRRPGLVVDPRVRHGRGAAVGVRRALEARQGLRQPARRAPA